MGNLNWTRKEYLIINGLMERAPWVAYRTTISGKAHREGDDSRMALVIKDSWQFPEREMERVILREAKDKERGQCSKILSP